MAPADRGRLCLSRRLKLLHLPRSDHGAAAHQHGPRFCRRAHRRFCEPTRHTGAQRNPVRADAHGRGTAAFQPQHARLDRGRAGAACLRARAHRRPTDLGDTLHRDGGDSAQRIERRQIHEKSGARPRRWLVHRHHNLCLCGEFCGWPVRGRDRLRASHLGRWQGNRPHEFHPSRPSWWWGPALRSADCRQGRCRQCTGLSRPRLYCLRGFSAGRLRQPDSAAHLRDRQAGAWPVRHGARGRPDSGVFGICLFGANSRPEQQWRVGFGKPAPAGGCKRLDTLARRPAGFVPQSEARRSGGVVVWRRHAGRCLPHRAACRDADQADQRTGVGVRRLDARQRATCVADRWQAGARRHARRRQPARCAGRPARARPVGAVLSVRDDGRAVRQPLARSADGPRRTDSLRLARRDDARRRRWHRRCSQ